MANPALEIARKLFPCFRARSLQKRCELFTKGRGFRPSFLGLRLNGVTQWFQNLTSHSFRPDDTDGYGEETDGAHDCVDGPSRGA